MLKETSVVDITEFGRAVHAEMEALLSSARSGISPRGATLYCTTFPCHNCAKHLVAAGVERVVYVEPYPKSQAEDLHSDAISFDRPAAGKVSFEPFVGLGPRRYFDLFAMKLGRGYDVVRKRDGLKLPWERERKDGEEADGARRHKKGPRVPMLPSSYIHREDYVARDIEALLRRKGLETALEELKKWKK